MKKIILLTLSLTGIIIVSCNSNQSEKSNNQMDDTVILSKSDLTEETVKYHHIIHYDILHLDSTIANYQVTFNSIENGIYVWTYPITDGKGQDTVLYESQDLKLKIIKGQNDVLIDKTFHLDDFKKFIPQAEINKYILTSFNFQEVGINNIKFQIGYCHPESDICYLFNLTIEDEGNIKIKEEIDEESDF